MREDFAELVNDACTTALGGAVSYRPKSGGEFQVEAIFKRPYIEVGEGEPPVSSQTPVIGLNLTELKRIICTDPEIGDTVVIKCTEFRVHRIEPDSQTGVTIYMHEPKA